MNRAALTYDRLFVETTSVTTDDSLILPVIRDGYVSSWAQYTLRLSETVDRAALQTYLKEHGIPTMVYYMKPMHSQKAFAGTYSENAMCPTTEILCNTVLSLPLSPYITESEIEEVVRGISEFPSGSAQ